MADKGDAKPEAVIGAILYMVAFPHGGKAMMSELDLTLQSNQWERDEARIAITTGVPWEMDSDTVEAVRRRAVASAHRLLKAAAALSEDELFRLLDESSLQEDLLDIHRCHQRH
ncbi:MAG: hypothetical protein ACOH2H_15265 [Cypionkella sp.]